MESLGLSHLRLAYEGKKVLITGHTGFKGSWLCEWLLTLGAEVTGFSLAPESQECVSQLLHLNSRMDYHLGDVRDKEAFSKVLKSSPFDYIFHLAAQPLVRESYVKPLETCEINIMGTCHLMESARSFRQDCAIVVVTTDKCYNNQEIPIAYTEEHALGGCDLYSASKAAVELLVNAYRHSFFSDSQVRLATARAGNVIGGGDVAQDRLIPDAIRAIRSKQPMLIRNKNSIRPWQHVLEPLSGYLWLGASLLKTGHLNKSLSSAFNFGPSPESNKTVHELALEISRYLPLELTIGNTNNYNGFHEAGLLHLNSNKAEVLLNWRPVWDFETAVKHTTDWYKALDQGGQAINVLRQDITSYESDARAAQLKWSID